MGPDDIATAMTGVLSEAGPGRHEAFLPSPKVQNHAAFLAHLSDGALICAWFGGTLEGKSDISIHASILPAGTFQWGPAQPLSGDPHRSEQNPVIFTAPDGGLWLFHTAQPSGNQDECQIRMARLIRHPEDPTLIGGDLPTVYCVHLDVQTGIVVDITGLDGTGGSSLTNEIHAVDEPLDPPS